MFQKLTNISNIIAYLQELNLLQIEGRDKRGVSFDLRNMLLRNSTGLGHRTCGHDAV